MLGRLLHALPPRPQEPLHARVVAVLRLLAAMAQKTSLGETSRGRDVCMKRKAASWFSGGHLLGGQRRLLAEQLADGLDLLPLLGVHLVDGHRGSSHEEEEGEVGVEEGSSVNCEVVGWREK